MSPDSPSQAQQPPPPSLGFHARIWLAAIPVVLLGSQTLFALYGPDLPASTITIVSVEDLVLGALAVTVVLWLLKIDRRVIGLTLGDTRTTLVRTAVQLVILAGLTVLYVAALAIAARSFHLKIPIEATSLTDFREAWIFILAAVVIGPIYEEILFRGMLIAAFDRPGKGWIAVLASTALFVLPHWGPGINPLILLNPLVTGLLLGWSYLRTRSVLTPILVHAAFNAGVIAKDFLMAFEPNLVRRVLGY